jgi:hypothetical protein
MQARKDPAAVVSSPRVTWHDVLASALGRRRIDPYVDTIVDAASKVRPATVPRLLRIPSLRRSARFMR